MAGTAEGRDAVDEVGRGVRDGTRREPAQVEDRRAVGEVAREGRVREGL